MKKIISSLLFIISFALMNDFQDVVYLKNGSIIKGSIVELIPGESIKIETSGGSIFVYNMNEVTKISKEEIKIKESKPDNFTLFIHENRLRRARNGFFGIYALTIAADIALGAGVESEMVIPVIGPILAKNNANSEGYEEALIFSGVLQAYFLWEYLNVNKEIKNNKLSYFFNPVSFNPSLSLTFKF